MCELAFWGHVNLRGDSGDEAFQAGVEKAVGARVPITPNTVARAGERTIVWLGPDEWLVVSSPDSREGVADGLERGPVRAARCGERHIERSDDNTGCAGHGRGTC